MSIAHRATSSATATVSTADSVSPAVPTGTTDGDLLLAWVSTADAKTITPPAGWTQLAEYLGGGNTIWFGYRIASGESGSYTFTWTDSQATAIISAYSGVDGTSPIICHRAENTASSIVFTAPALSPLTTDPTVSFLVTFMSWARGLVTSTAPTGYTMPANGNPDTGGTSGTSVESGVAYKSYTGGSGIASAQWNGTNAGAHTVVHIALREAGDTQELISAWPGQRSAVQSGTSLALVMPYAHRTNDLLVCPVLWKGDSVSASISGWTQKGTTVTKVVGGSSDWNMALFYKYAASSSESGTVTLSPATPDDIVATAFPIRRSGTSGDPFADYQTVDDATSDTSWDYPALTVTAQDMLLIAFVGIGRGDNLVANPPTGFAGWADPNSTFPNINRSGAAAGDALISIHVKYQNTANPASGSITPNAALISVGAQAAVALGTLASAATRRPFYGTILG